MKKILLDVDGVVCFPGFLNAVNEFMGTNYKLDDFKEYFIDKVAIPQEFFNDFNEFLNMRNIYDDAIVLPNAVETIEKLNRLYDIYICSSCINPFDLYGSGRLFKDKYEFLINTLPFIRPENYVFTSTKHIFKADIQIDDLLSNFDSDIGTKILFPSYHNKNISNEELKSKGIIRAGYNYENGWDEVSKILIK